MNLDTSFIFLEGPIKGNGEGILFETGKVEIHDNGEKIFFSGEATVPRQWATVNGAHISGNYVANLLLKSYL